MGGVDLGPLRFGLIDLSPEFLVLRIELAGCGIAMADLLGQGVDLFLDLNKFLIELRYSAAPEIRPPRLDISPSCSTPLALAASMTSPPVSQSDSPRAVFGKGQGIGQRADDKCFPQKLMGQQGKAGLAFRAGRWRGRGRAR